MSEIRATTVMALTPTDRLRRDYEHEDTRILQCNAHAQVIKGQLAQAYSILDSVSISHLRDSMFVDYLSKAKREIAGALSDFLLSDAYWQTRKQTHRAMTPEQWDDSQNHTEASESPQ